MSLSKLLVSFIKNFVKDSQLSEIICKHCKRKEVRSVTRSTVIMHRKARKEILLGWMAAAESPRGCKGHKWSILQLWKLHLSLSGLVYFLVLREESLKHEFKCEQTSASNFVAGKLRYSVVVPGVHNFYSSCLIKMPSPSLHHQTSAAACKLKLLRYELPVGAEGKLNNCCATATRKNIKYWTCIKKTFLSA